MSGLKVYKKAVLPICFKANAVACGIKKSNKLDLALFYSQIPAKAACKFTTNKVLAAPIKLNKQYLKANRSFRAVIVNSGNANCFTGSSGLKDAETTSKILGRALSIKKEASLLASTGIIGRRLPLHKIKKNIPELVRGLSTQGIDKAKLAILTTDTFVKELAVQFNIADKTITLCGIAKGAGMIAPNIATMLAFILTDANITQKALNIALRICVQNSFNCITVDGCMSTNDSVIMLANGAAGNGLIDENKNFAYFIRALSLVSVELAKMIVQDAEGSTKFIQIKVDRARNTKEAKTAALSIANSPLFKAAMYGEDANFGRIVASIGASGISIRENDLKISLSPLNKKDITVNVSLNMGSCSATVYTSDLTPEYVKINAQYN